MGLRGTVEVLNHGEPIDADSFLGVPDASPSSSLAGLGQETRHPLQDSSSFLSLSAARPCASLPPPPSASGPSPCVSADPSPASRSPSLPLMLSRQPVQQVLAEPPPCTRHSHKSVWSAPNPSSLTIHLQVPPWGGARGGHPLTLKLKARPL